MHRPKYDRAVRQWDAPTKIGDGGMVMECAGEKWQWWHGEGMRRRKMAMGTANKYAGRKQGRRGK